jgi:F-type H+-transporting ATPase subunit epsilon
MPLELTIVTPEKQAFHGPVERIVLPGSEGDFGVLEGHERFLAPLRIGEAEILLAGEGPDAIRYAAVSEGFADVRGERVVVMVDTCELATDIDVARAERARERAQREVEALQGQDGEEIRFRVAQAAVERALTRIRVGGRV